MALAPRRLPGWPAPRQWLARWLANRAPRTDQLQLTQRNVYILPTRPGWMLGVTLLVMLVGSINYQLNLGYLLTFLLAGAAAVSMHVSHATLRGLSLKLTPPEACHAGALARVEVVLTNPDPRARYGIGVAMVAPGHPPHWVHTDVPAQGRASVTVGWQPPARGRHGVPTLTLETRFPLGTFRVWAVWRPAANVLVYPKPETHPPPLPAPTPTTLLPTAATHQGSGELDGVRAYRRGDPLKSVVWKRAAQAMARGSADLVSRDASGNPSGHELRLDWRHTGTSDAELRAARLTAWVLTADRLGLDYGLCLPHSDIAPDQGPRHRQHCLEALALC